MLVLPVLEMDFAKGLVSAALARGQTFVAELSKDLPDRQPSGGLPPAGPTGSLGGAPSAAPVGNGRELSSASSSTSSALPVETRVMRFKQELAGSHINVYSLKRLAFNGIPDQGNLRATVWKVTWRMRRMGAARAGGPQQRWRPAAHGSRREQGGGVGWGGVG